MLLNASEVEVFFFLVGLCILDENIDQKNEASLCSCAEAMLTPVKVN